MPAVFSHQSTNVSTAFMNPFNRIDAPQVILGSSISARITTRILNKRLEAIEYVEKYRHPNLNI